MGLLAEWRAERERRHRAALFVRVLHQEPEPDDVSWLATMATAGDSDHARWELRYARRAMGLLVARRDALDDRTASLVAHELVEALARDPHVGTGRLSLAERQLNDRLRSYGDALTARAAEPTGTRLAKVLVGFATAGRDATDPRLLARAGAIIARYMDEANGALRDAFGAASLPEDIAPSAVAQGRQR
jgi:hypothetical protein